MCVLITYLSASDLRCAGYIGCLISEMNQDVPLLHAVRPQIRPSLSFPTVIPRREGLYTKIDKAHTAHSLPLYSFRSVGIERERERGREGGREREEREREGQTESIWSAVQPA